MTRVGRKLVDESGTLAGATITMIDAVRYTAATLDLPLASALTMATLTLARLLGLDAQVGRLAAGFEANLVHLTSAIEVAGVWMNGRACADDGEPRLSRGSTHASASPSAPRLRRLSSRR